MRSSALRAIITLTLLGPLVGCETMAPEEESRVEITVEGADARYAYEPEDTVLHVGIIVAANNKGSRPVYYSTADAKLVRGVDGAWEVVGHQEPHHFSDRVVEVPPGGKYLKHIPVRWSEPFPEQLDGDYRIEVSVKIAGDPDGMPERVLVKSEPFRIKLLGDPPLAPPGSIDSIFLAINDEVPGFAGLIIEEGRPTVLLTDLAALDAAREALAPLLAQPPLVGHELRWRRVEYEWRELLTWRAALGKHMPRDIGKIMVSTDVDEARNRIVYGILPDADETPLLDAIARSDVPREAVVIVRGQRMMPWTSTGY